MLVATQLLAGGGVAVQLCVSGDGSYCCLDGGPGDCDCCREFGGDSKKTEAAPAEGCGSECCGHHEPVKPRKADPLEAFADAACRCTHVPLVLSTDEQAIATRSHAALSDPSADVLAVWVPTTLVYTSSVVSSPPPLRWSQRSTVPDYAVVVIATTVLRC